MEILLPLPTHRNALLVRFCKRLEAPLDGVGHICTPFLVCGDFHDSIRRLSVASLLLQPPRRHPIEAQNSFRLIAN